MAGNDIYFQNFHQNLEIFPIEGYTCYLYELMLPGQPIFFRHFCLVQKKIRVLRLFSGFSVNNSRELVNTHGFITHSSIFTQSTI